ncbi:hypothetical protein BC828DRAFT_388795 [Blastocladiella britannica]|nr:hypothetical protein BC828DRAFT_388795 [Blastocladiella britannica]
MASGPPPNDNNVNWDARPRHRTPTLRLLAFGEVSVPPLPLPLRSPTSPAPPLSPDSTDNARSRLALLPHLGDEYLPSKTAKETALLINVGKHTVRRWFARFRQLGTSSTALQDAAGAANTTGGVDPRAIATATTTELETPPAILTLQIQFLRIGEWIRFKEQPGLVASGLWRLGCTASLELQLFQWTILHGEHLHRIQIPFSSVDRMRLGPFDGSVVLEVSHSSPPDELVDFSICILPPPLFHHYNPHKDGQPRWSACSDFTIGQVAAAARVHVLTGLRSEMQAIFRALTDQSPVLAAAAHRSTIPFQSTLNDPTMVRGGWGSDPSGIDHADSGVVSLSEKLDEKEPL